MYNTLTQNQTATLAAEVVQKEGNVDSVTARRFITHVLYGSYPRIDLENLPTNLKLNLADAIASDQREPSSVAYLDALYQSFGFNRILINAAEKEVIDFFKPENLEIVGSHWPQGNFVNLLNSMTNNGSAFSADQKLEVLQFLSNAYNDFLNAPPTKVQLFEGDPNLKGYYEPKTGSVFLNSNTPEFKNDFSKLVNTIFHENKHNSDLHPSEDVGNTYARLMNVNARGYISAEAGLGYDSYRRQPLELSAHAAGNAAEAMTKTLAAANDDAPLPRGQISRSPSYIILIAA